MYIVNHLEFTVIIHKATDDAYRVIGFEVEPFSVQASQTEMFDINGPLERLEVNKPITFSHSFKTKIDPMHKWATRMDHYLKFSSHYEQVYHE